MFNMFFSQSESRDLIFKPRSMRFLNLKPLPWTWRRIFLQEMCCSLKCST